MFSYLQPRRPCGTPVALLSERALGDLLINIIKNEPRLVFLSLGASQRRFAASAACRRLIKTACRISPSTLIGEDEACWQWVQGLLGNCWLWMDPAVMSVTKASKEPPSPPRTPTPQKKQKESETDRSTNLKGSTKCMPCLYKDNYGRAASPQGLCQLRVWSTERTAFYWTLEKQVAV